MPCGHELSFNPFRKILEGGGGGGGRERGSKHIDTEQFCSKQNASPMPAMAVYDVLGVWCCMMCWCVVLYDVLVCGTVLAV